MDCPSRETLWAGIHHRLHLLTAQYFRDGFLPLVFIGIAIIFAMVGCNISTTSVGEEQTETKSIELGSAESAKGVGEITINLPAGMGVKVDSKTAFVNVSTTGLNKNGNIYTNDAYETAEYTLTLDLEAGVGSVNLVVAE